MGYGFEIGFVWNGAISGKDRRGCCFGENIRQAVELVPATLEDVESIIGRKPEWRVRGIAARLDGKTIGVGGAVYRRDGVWAFVAMKPEAKKYPVAIHRAGLMAIKLFRELGLAQISAWAEDGIAPAERWLLRLGFKPVNGAYIWRDN